MSASIALAVLVTASTACSRSVADTQQLLKVAYFADLSVDDAGELIGPALTGLQTGLVAGGSGPFQIKVEEFDVSGAAGDPVALAARVGSDTSYVAAVVGPYWQEPSAFAQALSTAGVPVLDLSPEGTPAGTWRGLVPEQASQARRLSSSLESASRGRGLCLITQTAPYTADLISEVQASLKGPVMARFDVTKPEAVTSAVAGVDRAGCGTAGFIGFPTTGAALRDAMDARGLAGVRLIAADPMKTLSYIQVQAHDGTLVTCPCADVTTSRGSGPQQLVHDYQLATGWEPGSYAAEGWDAAMMLAAAVRGGASSRALVASTIGRMRTFDGVARRYTFDASGWTLASSGLYEARNTRWLPVMSAR